MVSLVLSREEAETLAATLERELSDMSYEIANTDSLDYRTTLKQRKATLGRVLESLTATRQMV